MRRFPFITTTVTVVVLAAWVSPQLREFCLFERTEIMNGQWWRFLTGHLVHFSPSHLMFDSAVFLLAGAIVEERSRKLLIGLLLTSVAAISTGLFWFAPQLQFYGGMSGVATAMLCFVAFEFARERGVKRAVGVTVITLATIKMAWEIQTSHALFSTLDRPDIQLAPMAHIVGTLVAATMWSAIWCWQKMRVTSSSPAEMPGAHQQTP
jgi:rhomboid family GlyGly-CTERM serine protease